VKPRSATAQFGLCLLGGILIGWILLLDVSLKWEIASLAALGTAALMVGGSNRILLFMLVFSVPFYFGKALISRPEHLGLSSGVIVNHTDILALVLLLLFLARLALGHMETRPFPLIMAPALVWLVFSAPSILAARDGEFVIIQLINMGKLLLLCWVVAKSIKNEADLIWVITALMLAMLFQAFVGIYQGVSGRPVGLDFLTETTAVQKQVLSEGLANRVQGTIGHPNSYAMYLTTVLPFALALLFSRIRRSFKLVAGIALSFGFLALIYSLSRSAWINFLVTICIVLLLAVRRKRISSKAAIRIAIATSLILVGFTLFGPKIILSRLTSPDRGSAHGRITLAQTALAIIKDHPWVGVGLNNYQLVSPQYDATNYVRNVTVHNLFLLIAAETGLVGLAAFLTFLAILLVQAWRIIKRAPNDIVWVAGVGVFSTFIVVVLHGITDYALLGSVQLITQFWIIAGLSAALIQRIEYEERNIKHISFRSNTAALGFHSY
jgi:putative inorganic carbon (HCO3(-)) transporter